MKKNTMRNLAMIAGGLCLVALMLYMGGAFNFGQIKPGLEGAAAPAQTPVKKTARAEKLVTPVFLRAVGTVRPRTETKVESQVMGRILSVKVRPGDRVQAGQLLAVLDGRGLTARLAQAKQGLAAARAGLTRAAAQRRRIKRYLKGEAATQRDMENAEAAFRAAAARMRQARQQVNEAEIALGHTRVKAPAAGVVAGRLAEPGDLAVPGRPLVLLHTAGSLRLEALVREGLIAKVVMGAKLHVVIPALRRRLTGTVEEVVPTADPTTRSFLVKVGLPATSGIYPGMFGRLMIPVGKRPVVLIPARAVIKVGQLAMVRVRRGKTWQRVYVTLGRLRDGKREVLSGINPGDIVALVEAPDA